MKYLRQFSIYTVVGFLGAGVSLILMPYLSHFLTPDEYGILSNVNSLVTVLIPFIGLAAAGLINIDYYKIKDKNEFASLFSSVQFVPVIPFFFFFIISFLFKNPIAAFLEIPIEKSYWIPLSTVIAFTTIYFETLIAYNVTEQKPWFYAIFNVGKLIVEVCLTIFFVTKLRLGWEGRLIAWGISSFILFLAGFLYYKKEKILTANINKKHIRAAVLFGLPLILHIVGKFVINQSDRIFITKMVSLYDAGIYNMGYQVGMVMLLFVNAVGNFFQPFLFERLAVYDEKAKIQIVKTTYYITAGFFILLLLMTLVSPYFFSIFIDEKYKQSVSYIFWVGLSYFFWGVYILFAGYIFYTKKTKVLGYLSLLNVILNIVLNFLFIKKFGALGAAYATCVSFFVVSVIIVLRSLKLFPDLPWAKGLNRIKVN